MDRRTCKNFLPDLVIKLDGIPAREGCSGRRCLDRRNSSVIWYTKLVDIKARARVTRQLEQIIHHRIGDSMKKVLIVPVLAAAMFAGACSDPITVTPSAKVRFFNVTPGLAGNFGFTTNGTFAAGSALAFAQSTCSTVDAGPTSFGFGPA